MGTSARLQPIDWTKGVLVVCMVAYHAFCYSPFRPLAFQHLGFLPPSFIVITGFIVGQFYASKYNLSSWAPYGRLLSRGLKILALFTVLNLLLYGIQFRAFGPLEGLLEFVSHGNEIYLIGAGRVASFEVLVPIAYFLLLAPGLVSLSRFAPWSTAAVALAAAALCFGLERKGVAFEHLNLLSAGLLGMVLGAVPLKRIDAWASRLWFTLPLFLAYRLVSYFIGETYLVQTVGACIALLFTYSLALKCCSLGWLSRHIVLLGNYSLFAYLAQVAVLHVLRVVLGIPQHAPLLIAMMVITLASTVLLVLLAAKLRAEFAFLNRAYKTVFA